MKKILATITVLVTFGALVWHQLPTDDYNVVIEDIVEVEEPILPPSNAFPEIDLDRHIVRPFDEQFALAREELGPDGLFEWQGREYHCLYREELEDLINRAIEDSTKDDSSVKHSIQIVETVIPVEVIEDSTLIQSNADFEGFKP
tara:strand:- start:762 stop:1196 length:435 start_codon:yes stop_codon:yes gene_type:complete